MNEQILAIVNQLGTLSAALDTAVQKLGEFEETAIDAEGDYKLKFAKAFRAASGSVEDRKQQATIECDQEWRTWGKAASLVRVQKESLKALHSRIDVGRTMQATARAEIGLAGLGGTP